MAHRLCLLGLVAALFTVPQAKPLAADDKDKPVRVLFVLNGHDYAPKAPILEKLLAGIGGFQVTRLEAKGGDSLNKLGVVKRADYDVLVCYGGPQANEVQERGLEKFVEEGGGIVALHHASANPSQAWLRLIGAKFAGHPPLQDLNVVIADVKHPITAGVGSFKIFDEPYRHKVADVPRTVLARFKERPGDKDPKSNLDIIWTREIGKGRIVYNALGHGKEAWTNPAWQKLTVQAILWAAGQPREIKLPPGDKAK